MLVASAAPALTRLWRTDRPIDLHAMLGPMRRGTGDPTFHAGGVGSVLGPVWRASRTPDGPATLRLTCRPADAAVAATAWGRGAQWMLDALPDLLGAGDDVDGFRPRHPVVRETWRRHRGWRVPRSRLVLEALVPAILEQKVTSREAWRAWRWLLQRHGEPAPGPPAVVPAGLRVQPTPEVWRRIPSWDWHRAGVDHARSSAILHAVASARGLEAGARLPVDEARARLQALPGVGVWTSAEVAQRALGDADAVSVGDFHLPAVVGWALAGCRVDDDGMLELLEPYRGHRYRAIRLVELSGRRPPRRGPRLPPRDYRTF